MGTELHRRGVATPLPGWSAHALTTAPGIVTEVHRDYALAGADVHTANTFRTQRRHFPSSWRELLATAVDCARRGAGPGRRIAGAIAPLEDCYDPAASPPEARKEHRELVRALAEEGVDLLLVETFPHIGEALVATEEAVATGIETWVSFTAGPDANLLSVEEIRSGGRRAVAAGAGAVLVNCVPTRRLLGFLEGIADLGVAFGGYANAGESDDRTGFLERPIGAEDYAEAAAAWVALGASILGSCCGTGVGHIAALRDRFPAGRGRDSGGPSVDSRGRGS